MWRRVVRSSLLATLVVLLLACHAGSGEGLDFAQRTTRDASRFSSNERASVAYARIADRLLDAGRACVRSKGRDDPTCRGTLAGASFAQVMADAALDCNQADVQRARAALSRYLATSGRWRDGAVPSVPEIPSCA
jgi:hypothetical protein